MKSSRTKAFCLHSKAIHQTLTSIRIWIVCCPRRTQTCLTSQVPHLTSKNSESGTILNEYASLGANNPHLKSQVLVFHLLHVATNGRLSFYCFAQVQLVQDSGLTGIVQTNLRSASQKIFVASVALCYARRLQLLGGCHWSLYGVIKLCLTTFKNNNIPYIFCIHLLGTNNSTENSWIFGPWKFPMNSMSRVRWIQAHNFKNSSVFIWPSLAIVPAWHPAARSTLFARKLAKKSAFRHCNFNSRK